MTEKKTLEQIADDLGNVRCRSCLHFDSCKRVDHNVIRFYRPFFRCDTSVRQDHVICRSFSPSPVNKHLFKNWTGFDLYWKAFMRYWFPKDDDALIPFCIGNDTDTIYRVKLDDFVNGTMYDYHGFKAVERTYYQRCGTGFGYRLITEKIDGVRLTHGQWLALKECGHVSMPRVEEEENDKTTAE